jgi:hypothetical protein
MSGGKPSGIRGRQNAGGTDSWWVWLAKNGLGYASSVENEDGTFSYYYDKYQLEDAYNDFVSFWSENFGPENAPSFPEWLDWFMSAVGDSGYTYKNNTYHFVPIGNILPLFFITLIYAIILFVKRNKTAQL